MPKSRIPLKTIAQVGQEMAKIYRSVKGNLSKMNLDDAKDLSLLLKRIGDLIVQNDFEDRLKALESEILKNRENSRFNK